MKQFFWKIAGGDPELLNLSGRDSQYSFYLIGLLYVIINILIFGGFLGLFIGVFEMVFVAVIAAAIFGFLVSNIYRLTLMSLEPQVLPVPKEEGTVLLPYILRYAVVVAFAFFVSKCDEMVIVSAMEYFEIIKFNDEVGYMSHLIEANLEQEWVWVVTTCSILLFITPIYMRQRLKDRTAEYYSLKQKRDIRIVKENYEAFLKEKRHILEGVYSHYTIGDIELQRLKKSAFYNSLIGPKYVEPHQQLVSSFRYSEHVSKYIDEPFRTKRRENNELLKSSDEFTHLDDWI